MTEQKLDNFGHFLLKSILPDDHHSRKHNHSDPLDNTVLKPDSISLLSDEGDQAVTLNQPDDNNDRVWQITTNTNHCNDIYIGVGSDHENPTGTTRAIRIEGSRLKYFNGTTWKECKWVGDSPTSHNHSGEAITPASLVTGAISGTTGLFSALLTATLGGLISGAAFQVNGQDIEILDGGKLILKSAGNDKTLTLTHNDTTATLLSSEDIQLGSSTIPDVLRVRSSTKDIYMQNATTLHIRSAGNDKEIKIEHDDTDAYIIVPSSDGNLFITIGALTWKLHAEGVLEFPQLTADPEGTSEGMIWYDGDVFRIHDGTGAGTIDVTYD